MAVMAGNVRQVVRRRVTISDGSGCEIWTLLCLKDVGKPARAALSALVGVDSIYDR
jgi:hypothetical protein